MVNDPSSLNGQEEIKGEEKEVEELATGFSRNARATLRACSACGARAHYDAQPK